jgi:hypothetical protein
MATSQQQRQQELLNSALQTLGRQPLTPLSQDQQGRGNMATVEERIAEKEREIYKLQEELTTLREERERDDATKAGEKMKGAVDKLADPWGQASKENRYKPKK